MSITNDESKTGLQRTSYSALQLFQRCRKAWWFRYIGKLPDIPGVAAQRGTRLHLAGERALKGEIPPEQLPIQFKLFVERLMAAQEAGAQSESTWLADRDWAPVQDESAAMLKAIIDIHWLIDDELYIVDLKSGKVRPEHADQLELYAIIGAARYPKVTKVNVAVWYLDHGLVDNQKTHFREWLQLLQPVWRAKIDEVQKAQEWPTTPSIFCKWCSFVSHCPEGQTFLEEIRRGNQ
jgi:PD-(D/E)XK nuclease superfamily